MSKTFRYVAGAVGVITGAAVAGFGSGIGNAYGRHLMASGQLPLPGAPRGPRQIEGRRAKAPGKLWKREKGVRIYRDVEWDQYVVAPDLDDEMGFYYTPDREDAVQTAGWIAENEAWSVKP